MSGPWFLTGGATAGIIVVLATILGGLLGGAEWRRGDRRQRLARVAASLAATGALAVLALRPAAWSGGKAEPGPDGAGAEVALWTAGPRPQDEAEALRAVPADLRFALPGVEAPAGTQPIPDVAALRRNIPSAHTLHLLGEGLEADTLAGLSPWRVIFHPGPDGTVPRFTATHAPRTLEPGEPWWVAGQVRGGSTGEARTVVWQGPDLVPMVAPVAADGTFRLRGPGLPTPGRFGWKLRLVGAGERVLEEEVGGVTVVAPDLPRTLVLESSPHPDTTALRRWLGAAGGAVVTRTEIGQGRFRFAATGGAPGEFTGLDPTLLSRFDVVVTDARALAGLPAPERGELRRAVDGRGLGLLVMGDLPGPGQTGEMSSTDRAFFSPWQLVPSGEEHAADAATEMDPPTRLRWAGKEGEERAPGSPVPVLPLRVSTVEGDGSVVLVRDGQGRAVTARGERGRGRVALTLTTDTARWRREGEPGDFAAFWSAVLGDLVAPSPARAVAGRWTLAGQAAAGPGTCMDTRVELCWQGPHEGATPPSPGIVTAEEAPEGESPIPLELTRDATTPTRWATHFWPRHAGWHRVRTPKVAGPPLDFFVAPANGWPGVRATARRLATARFVTQGERDGDADGATGTARRPPGGVATNSGLAAGALFLVFVAAAGFLWAEGRRSG